MTAINEGLAQQVVMQTEETFQQFKERIFQVRYPLKFRDEVDEHNNVIKQGGPIEVEPDSFYSFLRLQLARPATPTEFVTLFGLIMGAVAQAETAGIIPANWVKEVATPFDLITGSIPEHITEALPENTEVKTYVDGEIRYRVEIVPKAAPAE